MKKTVRKEQEHRDLEIRALRAWGEEREEVKKQLRSKKRKLKADQIRQATAARAAGKAG